MTTFGEDPVFNAVYDGIKRDIQTLLDAKRWRGALILIYSGMDAMAWVGMNGQQEDVDRSAFVAWAERYIRFQGSEQLTGLDLYGARCALLHNYSVFSRLSREGKCRVIGYTDRMVPPIRYAPAVSTEMVMVSLYHLADSFFEGVDRFLIDVFADSARRTSAEARLRKLIMELPMVRGED
jgi:hypothetical protein